MLFIKSKIQNFLAKRCTATIPLRSQSYRKIFRNGAALEIAFVVAYGYTMGDTR
jgi:hypothetical protein